MLRVLQAEVVGPLGAYYSSDAAARCDISFSAPSFGFRYLPHLVRWAGVSQGARPRCVFAALVDLFAWRSLPQPGRRVGLLTEEEAMVRSDWHHGLKLRCTPTGQSCKTRRHVGSATACRQVCRRKHPLCPAEAPCWDTPRSSTRPEVKQKGKFGLEIFLVPEPGQILTSDRG